MKVNVFWDVVINYSSKGDVGHESQDMTINVQKSPNSPKPG